MAIILPGSGIRKRPKKYYRMVVTVGDDAADAVNSVEVSFHDASSGAPLPNPSSMILSKGKVKDGIKSFTYKKLDFKGNDPVGQTYTITATMKDANNNIVGAPDTQNVAITDNAGVNIANATLKRNAGADSYTFEAVLKGEINKVDSVSINLEPLEGSTDADPTDYNCTVSKVTNKVKVLSNSNVTFADPDDALYNPYLASISLLDANGAQIDYIEMDVVVEE